MSTLQERISREASSSEDCKYPDESMEDVRTFLAHKIIRNDKRSACNPRLHESITARY
jgi:hypothetical protein